MQPNIKETKKSNNKKYDYICRVPNEDVTISNTSELKKRYYQELKKELRKYHKKQRIIKIKKRIHNYLYHNAI